MPNAYLQGIQGAFDNQAQIRNDIYIVAANWFVNRCPMVTRVPRVPAGSTSFSIVSRAFRARTAVIAAAFGTADTTIGLLDASPFMNGDVLELVSGERVEIVADPNLVTDTITVRRGAEATPSVGGSINDPIRLIGNSRFPEDDSLKTKTIKHL